MLRELLTCLSSELLPLPQPLPGVTLDQCCSPEASGKWGRGVEQEREMRLHPPPATPHTGPATLGKGHSGCTLSSLTQGPFLSLSFPAGQMRNVSCLPKEGVSSCHMLNPLLPV